MTYSLLRILNWNKFQQYKDRRPTWIKLYRQLLDNFEFMQLATNSQALLMFLWLLASEDPNNKGEIVLSPEKIAFRIRKPAQFVTDALDSLVTSGFVELEEQCTEAYGDVRNRTSEKRRDREETDVRTDTFRGDDGFEELSAIYPKRERGHAAAVAYQNAIGDICKQQDIQPADAHKWLMERTRLYVQRTEPRFQKGLTDYLTKHVYAQDESAWGGKGGTNGHSPPLQNPAEETRKRRGVMPSA